MLRIHGCFLLLFWLLSFSVREVYGQAFCSAPNAPINDNTTTSYQLNVFGTIGSIADLIVYIDLTHLDISDLSLRLVSPNGTSVYLFYQQCAFETDIITYFDDAGSAIQCPPISGFTIPDESLAAFDGQTLNGTWTLHIQDHLFLYSGTLFEWCVYATLDVDDSCPLSVKPQKAIPDPPVLQTISSQIVVSNTYGTITDLNIRIGITHPYIGDLRIWLVSPAGTNVMLFRRNCSSADNIITYFDDEGFPLNCSQTSGVPVIPIQRLSAFDGEMMNGIWTLYIQDSVSADAGMFQEWCLEPTIQSNCSDYSNTPLKVIKDLQTISDEFTVTGTTGVITDLNVRLGITHTWIGDLDIWMESPAGTIVYLYTRNCGYDTARFQNMETYFDDNNTSSVCPPVSGAPTVPVDPLSAFNGESLNGTWKIYVHDYVFYDNGILNGWCLIPALGECAGSAQCDDGNPCTSDLCQFAVCQNPCDLKLDNVVYTANSVIGCNDGSIMADITGCNEPWSVSLYLGASVQRIWHQTDGSSLDWDNVPSGNYLMVASTIAAGCSDSTNINIGPGLPCGIAIDTIASTPLSVQGCTDGTINAIVNAFVCDTQWSATLFNSTNDMIGQWSFQQGSAILWENLPSGNYRMVAADNGICTDEANVAVPAGPACQLQIQNVQLVVLNCDQNTISADVSALTCNNAWYAYLYVSDFSAYAAQWDYSLGSEITWSDIPLGSYHILLTNLSGCSDTFSLTLSCSDNDLCTIDSCEGGCSHTFKCEDNDACTEDFCQSNGQCQNQRIICNDGNACTSDSCINGNCINTPINCADNNLCTTDQCINGNCAHTTIVCNDGNACTNDFCQAGVCTFQPTCILNDNNPCTDDFCVNRTCLHPPKNCSDNNACTTDQCQAGQCINTPVCQLNDGNSCTIDCCVNASCTHVDTCSIQQCLTDANCDDEDLCTNDTCINAACQFIPINCDDGVSCTTDECQAGSCVNTPTCVIDDGDPCTIDGCVNGGCLHAPVNCNDASTCTNDFCQNGVCVFQPLCSLDDLDPCTNDFCLGGQCIHQDIFCNDGILCTIDTCQAGTCNYLPLYCDDGNECTTDSCLNGNCIYAPIPDCLDPCETLICTDGDACTVDSCINGSCNFPPLDCDDNNNCTLDSCIAGCVHNPVGTCNLALSGQIISEGGSAVAGVTVALNGSSNQSLVTTSDGMFNFNLNYGDDVTITPSKNNDITTNNGVSTLDIVLIQRQILAVTQLSSPYKKIAADVNNSQTVSTLDIVLTRAVILQSLHTFPGGRLWAFVNSDFTFPNPENPFPFENFRNYTDLNTSQSDQDFIAVKLGDVNNSWNPNVAKESSAGIVQFIIGDHYALPGEQLVVPVAVSDFIKITGYQFTLRWDPEIIHLKEVANNLLNGYFSTHAAEAGYLTTSWVDDMTKAISLPDNSPAFDLKFIVKGAAGSATEIAIGSGLIQSEAYNETLDLLTIAPTNGTIQVMGKSVSSPALQLNAKPNPFSGSTQIIFRLTEGNVGALAIHDLVGRKVKEFSGLMGKGEHMLEWNGDDAMGILLSEGLYHVRLTCGENSKTIKLSLIR